MKDVEGSWLKDVEGCELRSGQSVLIQAELLVIDYTNELLIVKLPDGHRCVKTPDEVVVLIGKNNILATRNDSKSTEDNP